MNKTPLPLVDLQHFIGYFGLILSPYTACIVIYMYQTCFNKVLHVILISVVTRLSYL